jgi:hypothetical protein
MNANDFQKEKELTHYEMVSINGGDPFSNDLGYALGKLAGWIKNAITAGPKSDNEWMTKVPPLTLFG